MKLRYIPNILSVIRLSLVPLFIYLFFKGENVSAVVVFAISGVTDFLDGFIARKYDCASNLGKLLDPMADKLTQFSAFLCLYIEELVPVWMVIVYFVKELGTAIGALFVFRRRKIVVKSHIFGKFATFFVFVFVGMIIAFPSVMTDNVVTVGCAVMCVYFVFSCLMYVKTEINGEVAKTINEKKEKNA